jgi:hypothetical protein
MPAPAELVPMQREPKRSNLQLGVTLAVIALVFFVGCIARMALLGR